MPESEDTVWLTQEAFDKLTKGDFDHLPEQAFFLIGGLDDLAKKATAAKKAPAKKTAAKKTAAKKTTRR